jgi:hypothetical protein
MITSTLHRDYATSLLADLQLSSAASLPRREVIADWLRDFVKSSRSGQRAAGSEDAPNLRAIHEHFLAHAVSGGARPVLD